MKQEQEKGGRCLCHGSESGFTLIEILLATFILAFGLISILRVFPSAVQAGKKTAQDTGIALVARQAAATLAYEAERGNLDFVPGVYPAGGGYVSFSGMPGYRWQADGLNVPYHTDLPQVRKVRIIVESGSWEMDKSGVKKKAQENFYTLLMVRP